MAPPRYRGAINNIFEVCLGSGVFMANMINYGTKKIKGGWGWRLFLALAAIPGLILTIGTIFLPETPNNIIQHTNDSQNAKAILHKIRGTNDVQAELDDLIEASLVAKSIENPFKKILQRKYRPQLVIAMAMQFFLILTGINIIGFYSPILLRAIGLNESVSLIMTVVISGVIGTTSTMMSMVVLDKLNRRFMLMLGGTIMVVSYSLVGAILAAQLGDQGSIGKGYAYLVLFMMCTYIAGFGWSWGALGWLVPSEILSLEVRSTRQTISVAVNFLMTFVIAQTFLAMLCHFRAGIFFFFAGWVVMMTAFVYFLLPEISNVPIEQMDGIWKEHWFWKRFVPSGGKEIKRNSKQLKIFVVSDLGQAWF